MTHIVFRQEVINDFSTNPIKLDLKESRYTITTDSRCGLSMKTNVSPQDNKFYKDTLQQKYFNFDIEFLNITGIGLMFNYMVVSDSNLINLKHIVSEREEENFVFNQIRIYFPKNLMATRVEPQIGIFFSA